MKKIVAGLILASVIMVSLGSVLTVSADPGTPPPAYGGQSGWGRISQSTLPGDGWMHDEMITALANELGMSVEELEKEIASGTTPAQIASEKGMTVIEFRELILRVRDEAIDLAVKNGTLTQEQSDWLNDRGSRRADVDRANQDGWLHTEMVTVLAKEFGLSVEELETLLDEGKTYAQIASDKGMTVSEFRVLMVKARSEAIDLAVENGTLTQEQADWMKSRSNMGRGGRGSGTGAGGGTPLWQQNQ